MRANLSAETFDTHDPRGSQAEALARWIGERARDLYETRRLLCTEAVVVALNRDLEGGLSDAQAVALAAPFCEALGESGCLCGALSGAVMACGLLLGKGRPYGRRREMRDCARELHDTFRAANGATCCRVLSRSVRHDPRAHFRQCAGLTEEAAGMAAALILKKRPELAATADLQSVRTRQTRFGGALKRLLRCFSRT